MSKKIVLIVLIVLLALGNVYFYDKSKKLDYDIMVGIPVKGEESDTVGINFSNSESLSSKDEENFIIFSLINATSIDKPKICNKLPDSTIWINDSREGATYCKVNFWITENSIILENYSYEDKPQYEIIDNSYELTKIKEVIGKYGDIFK